VLLLLTKRRREKRMPRLGAGSDHGDASPRRLATAYAAPRNKFNFSNVILLVAFTFILRNIFFHVSAERVPIVSYELCSSTP
jgi:hypothetical protein